jgi:hypothetical protein
VIERQSVLKWAQSGLTDRLIVQILPVDRVEATRSRRLPLSVDLRHGIDRGGTGTPGDSTPASHAATSTVVEWAASHSAGLQ